MPNVTRMKVRPMPSPNFAPVEKDAVLPTGGVGDGLVDVLGAGVKRRGAPAFLDVVEEAGRVVGVGVDVDDAVPGCVILKWLEAICVSNPSLTSQKEKALPNTAVVIVKLFPSSIVQG